MNLGSKTIAHYDDSDPTQSGTVYLGSYSFLDLYIFELDPD